VTDRRLATLRAALGFLQIRPRAPELQLLHRWRAQFSAHPMWASVGYGAAPCPWRATQIAAWTAVKSR